MQRRDLATALFSTATAAAVMPRVSEAQTCTAPCYARTAAEIALGVTPTNFSFPPGYVYRYGTNTTPPPAPPTTPPAGTTDMTAAINICANVCRQGKYTLVLSPEPCLVSGTLDFSGIKVLGQGNGLGGVYHVVASSAQFDVIKTTGNTVLDSVSVYGGWDGSTSGLSGDILSVAATSPAFPYVVEIMSCQFINAKKRSIYIERGGYTSIYHTRCLAAGLHALEIFGTGAASAATTIRTYGSCQFGSTPNGYGIKLTEVANCTFRDAILEDTKGIQLNGNDNRAVTFDGVYQENTAGGQFITDNSSAGIGLVVRSCFGGNAAIPYLTNWVSVFFEGNSNLASGAVPLAGRVMQSDGGEQIVSATGNVTAAALALGPGTYLVFGTVQSVISTGPGNITQLACNLTTNASGSGLANSTSTLAVGADEQTYNPASGISDLRVNCSTVLQVTSATTIYLRAHIGISGTATLGCHGFINAVLL